MKKKNVKDLLAWYSENKRDLPWRHTKDSYKIWISETMLQQTRVETVIPYYERFLKNLPTVSSLAKIHEDELLKLWEGLGYYSRARNLQKAAKILYENGFDFIVFFFVNNFISYIDYLYSAIVYTVFKTI